MNPEEMPIPIAPAAERVPEEPLSMAAKWKTAQIRWAKDIKIAYISNPAARRDFSVQFRGNRSWPLFGSLILIMSVVSLYLFWSAAKDGLPPESIQEKLLQFCMFIFGMLGLALSLITPALAAASILSEKQNRSLDLVFSSPIKPTSYLLGKLMASYRMVWVLMALSLPFTAISTLMGGGTWWNILESYFLLSLQGLLFTTIGIYFASLVQKTVTALFYTYIAVSAYVAAVSFFGYQIIQYGSYGLPTPFQGGAQNFLTSLSPLWVEYASGTYTLIFGVAVPNFLIAGGLTLGAVKLILQCAAGLLNPLRDSERAAVRLKVAGVVAALSVCCGYLGGSGPNVNEMTRAITVLLPTIPLIAFLPFLACYSSDGERRQTHAKLFSLRDMLGKSVAGALPYIYLLLGASGLGDLAGKIVAHKGLSVIEELNFFYLVAFWTFGWGTARFASSFNHGMKPSRTLQFLMMVGVIGLPAPLFMWTTERFTDPNFAHSIWRWFLMGPFIGQADSFATPILSVLLFLSGLGLAVFSEKVYRKNVNKKKLERMASESVLSSSPNLAISPNESSVQQLVQGA